jgi:Flp pilus assembly protein TadB
MTAAPLLTAVLVVVTASAARRRLDVPTRQSPARPVRDHGMDRTWRRSGPTPVAAASRLVTLALVAFLALLAAMLLGTAFAAVGAAAALLWSRLRRVVGTRRTQATIDRSLPDALDLLVLAVRAGLTPRQAIAELATAAPEPIRPAFDLVVHRVERGTTFADSLRALPDMLGPRANAVAEVIADADRNGLPLGPVLDQLTTEARAARRRVEQTAARKLPIRLSFPLVLCTLPSFVLLAIAPAVIAALSSLGASPW